MNCAQERAHDYAFDLLDENETSAVEEHVKVCRACSDLVEGYRRETSLWQGTLRTTETPAFQVASKSRIGAVTLLAAGIIPLLSILAYLIWSTPDEVPSDSGLIKTDPREIRNALSGLMVDGEPGDGLGTSETGIFALALDPTKKQVEFSIKTTTVEHFDANGLEAVDFLVLANVVTLPPDKLRNVEEFVRRGGGLLITLGDQVDKAWFNERQWKNGRGLSPARLEGVVGSVPGALDRGTEHRIATFSKSHPVMRTFRGELAPSLKELVFYRHYNMAGFEKELVLARLDDTEATPLLLEKKVGKGRVILFNNTLDAEWNSGIHGQPPWFPLMRNLSYYLARAEPQGITRIIGDGRADSGKIRGLVQMLSSPVIEKRETATQDLLAMGKGALPILEGMADSKDAEVRARLDRIIRNLKTPEPDEALKRIESTLTGADTLRITAPAETKVDKKAPDTLSAKRANAQRMV